MKRRKKKQPSKTMRPSRESVWKRAAGAYHLTPEEVAMAKAAGFTPTLMDEVATGKRVKRRVHDKLPSRAMPGQIKRVKREIRNRHAAKVKAKSAAGSSAATAAQSTTEGAASRNASRVTNRSVLANVSSKGVRRMTTKSKKEQRKMKHDWHMAGRVFRLSPNQILMAKLLGANPRTTFDKWRDRAKELGISLATYVDRRYAAKYGNTHPMKIAADQKKPQNTNTQTKQESGASRSVARLIIQIPRELRKRMENHCARRGLKLADEVQAALEAHFPADTAPPEEPKSDETVEVPFQAA